MYVEVKGDKMIDLERALSQLSKQVKKAELMEDLRKNEFYLKKSKRLQEKSKDAFRRKRREENKAQKKNNNTF